MEVPEPIKKITKNCLDNEFKKPLRPLSSKTENKEANIWDLVSD